MVHGLYASLLDITVTSTKAAEPINMSFRIRTREGARNPEGGGRTPTGRIYLGLSRLVSSRRTQRYSQEDSSDAASGYQYSSTMLWTGLSAECILLVFFGRTRYGLPLTASGSKVLPRSSRSRPFTLHDRTELDCTSGRIVVAVCE